MPNTTLAKVLEEFGRKFPRLYEYDEERNWVGMEYTSEVEVFLTRKLKDYGEYLTPEKHIILRQTGPNYPAMAANEVVDSIIKARREYEGESNG